jgi:hypothetical protein
MSTLQEHYLLPIKLTVTKLSGLGEDTLFIGVFEVRQSQIQLPTCEAPYLSPSALQHVNPVPETATVWVLRGGTILSVDPAFSDWFGYTIKEVQEKSLSMLVGSGGDELEQCVASEGSATFLCAFLSLNVHSIRRQLSMARSAAAMEALQAIGGGTLLARTNTNAGAVAEGSEGVVAGGNAQDEQLRLDSPPSAPNGALSPVPPSDPFKQAASARPAQSR